MIKGFDEFSEKRKRKVDDMIYLTIRCERSYLQKLKVVAKNHGLSVSAMVIQFIDFVAGDELKKITPEEIEALKDTTESTDSEDATE